MSLKPEGQQATKRWVVRLRGLPWECTEDQIREFFHGLDIVQLKIVMMPYGRSSGEGVLEFANEESYRMGLGKHKEKIGRRYIEVNKSQGPDMDRAMGIAVPTSAVHQGAISQRSFVIRMRGLPFSALDEDVTNFFGKKGLQPLGVHLVKDEVGRPTGFCYVEFNTHDEQSLALTLNREYMGTRYVDIFESTTSELERDVKKGLPLGIMTGGLGAPPRNSQGSVPPRRKEQRSDVPYNYGGNPQGGPPNQYMMHAMAGRPPANVKELAAMMLRSGAFRYYIPNQMMTMLRRTAAPLVLVAPNKPWNGGPPPQGQPTYIQYLSAPQVPAGVPMAPAPYRPGPPAAQSYYVNSAPPPPPAPPARYGGQPPAPNGGPRYKPY